MSKGPGLFSDIGKKARDLLTRDYLSDHKFSVSSCSESGVAITASTVEKGGYSSGDVQAQHSCKNTCADIKVDTESNIAATVGFTDIIPSSKSIATLKYPKYESGKMNQRGVLLGERSPENSPRTTTRLQWEGLAPLTNSRS